MKSLIILSITLLLSGSLVAQETNKATPAKKGKSGAEKALFMNKTFDKEQMQINTAPILKPVETGSPEIININPADLKKTGFVLPEPGIPEGYKARYGADAYFIGTGPFIGTLAY